VEQQQALQERDLGRLVARVFELRGAVVGLLGLNRESDETEDEREGETAQETAHGGGGSI
jgi:hypothetical protein